MLIKCLQAITIACVTIGKSGPLLERIAIGFGSPMGNFTVIKQYFNALTDVGSRCSVTLIRIPVNMNILGNRSVDELARQWSRLDGALSKDFQISLNTLKQNAAVETRRGFIEGCSNISKYS